MAHPIWAGIGGKTGPSRRYKDLILFACEGMVCVVDQRKGDKFGDFVCVHPAEMYKRAHAIVKTYRNQNKAELTQWQRQEHEQNIAGANAILECVKEAKDMGDPTDPRVQAYWKQHGRNRSVSVSTAYAGSVDILNKVGSNLVTSAQPASKLILPV